MSDVVQTLMGQMRNGRCHDLSVSVDFVVAVAIVIYLDLGIALGNADVEVFAVGDVVVAAVGVVVVVVVVVSIIAAVGGSLRAVVAVVFGVFLANYAVASADADIFAESFDIEDAFVGSALGRFSVVRGVCMGSAKLIHCDTDLVTGKDHNSEIHGKAKRID